MRILFKKLFRTIIKNWIGFFSAFLMVFLSLLFYIGLQGTWYGMDKSLTNYMNQSKVADSWVQASYISSDQFHTIEKIKGIDILSETLSINTSARVKDNNKKKSVNLNISTFNASGISRLKLMGGKKLDKSKSGIYLNKPFADANNLKVGDYVSVNSSTGFKELKVLGTVLSPDSLYYTGSSEYTTPQYKEYGYGFISDETLRNDFLDMSPKYNLTMRTSRNVEKEIQKSLGSSFITYQTRATNPNISMAVNRVSQIKRLSLMFSALFALLAILAVYTTIQRLIIVQVKDIASLQAIGYSKKVIVLYYSSYGFIIGVGATLLAWVIAPLLSNFVLDSQKAMFSLPKWTIAYKMDSVFICIIMILVVVLSSTISANRNRKIPLSSILKGESLAKGGKNYHLGGRLTIGNRWAIRDSLQHPVRIIMSIIGVSGGIALIMVGLGTQDTMKHQVNQSYGKEFTYYQLLKLGSQATPKQISDMRKKVDGQEIAAGYATLDWKSEISNESFTVIDNYSGGSNYINLTTTSGKKIKDDGLYITKGLARRLNIGSGDILELQPSMSTKKLKMKVKGILDTKSLEGVYISRKAYEKMGMLFRGTAILTDYKTSITSGIVSQSITLQSQKANGMALVKNLKSIFLLIISFGILLSVVISYNLGSLGFMERERDYTTLSVLGYSIKGIRDLTMGENVISTVLGVVIGVPFGMWFLDKYVSIFSSDQIVYYKYISILNLSLALGITILASLSMVLLLSRRLKSLDMIESLKRVE